MDDTGAFVVGIGHKGGKVHIEFTGEHYRGDEIKEAKEHVAKLNTGPRGAMGCRLAFYLINDEAVRLAMPLYGQCTEDGEEDAGFNSIIVQNVMLPDEGLPKLIGVAVDETIGSVRVVDTPEMGMSEKEVNQTLNRLGIKRKDRNETHKNQMQ